MKLREFFLFSISVKSLIIPVLLLLLVSFPACEDEFYETMEEEGIYFLNKDGSDAVNFPIADTGQTIAISGVSGEDSDYINIPREPSYTDNGDSTITDNVTGLMWMKCTHPDTSDDCTGTHNTYTWSQAVNECEDWTYAGYDDWYLPNSWELFSIIDLEQYPAIDATYFPNTEHDGVIRYYANEVTNGYWTKNKTYFYGPYTPFFIHFYDGMTNLRDGTTAYFVKCVRKTN